MATKITSEGQVTVPKSVRDHMGLRPWDAVDFVEMEGQPARAAAETALNDAARAGRLPAIS